jgi:SAM-dependent methyltransferase
MHVSDKVASEAIVGEIALLPGGESSRTLLDLCHPVGTIRSIAASVSPTLDIRSFSCLEEVPAALRSGKPGGFRLPFEDGSLDIVALRFVLHRLVFREKYALLKEIRRVLRESGTLVCVEWGRPENGRQALAFAFVRLIRGFESSMEHSIGVLPKLIESMRFSDVSVRRTLTTVAGPVHVLRAQGVDAISPPVE